MKNLRTVKALKDIPIVGIIKDNYYLIDTNSMHLDPFGNVFCHVYSYPEEELIMSLCVGGNFTSLV